MLAAQCRGPRDREEGAILQVNTVILFCSDEARLEFEECGEGEGEGKKGIQNLGEHKSTRRKARKQFEFMGSFEGLKGGVIACSGT